MAMAFLLTQHDLGNSFLGEEDSQVSMGSFVRVKNKYGESPLGAFSFLEIEKHKRAFENNRASG